MPKFLDSHGLQGADPEELKKSRAKWNFSWKRSDGNGSICSVYFNPQDGGELLTEDYCSSSWCN